jgi:hypothetical protein
VLIGVATKPVGAVGAWVSLKVAVTVVFVVRVTVQLVVLLIHPPVKPAKTEPVSAAAVMVTDDPTVKNAEQATPQLIPVGLEVTVPLPVPALLIVRDT